MRTYKKERKKGKKMQFYVSAAISIRVEFGWSYNHAKIEMPRLKSVSKKKPRQEIKFK